MVDHKNYIYRVIWSQEDSEHIGLCSEFPSLSYIDKNPQNAFRGIMDMVEDIIKDMKNKEEKIPDPLISKKYSGKFQMRIPPEQHRKLAIEAIEQGISLNRYLSSKLM